MEWPTFVPPTVAYPSRRFMVDRWLKIARVGSRETVGPWRCDRSGMDDLLRSDGEAA